MGPPLGAQAAGLGRREGSAPSNTDAASSERGGGGEVEPESFGVENGRLLPSSGMLQKSNRGTDQRRTLMVDGAPVMLDNLGPIIVGVRTTPKPKASPRAPEPPNQSPSRTRT